MYLFVYRWMGLSLRGLKVVRKASDCGTLTDLPSSGLKYSSKPILARC